MKKLLLIFLFISAFAFGQLNEDSIQKIAKEYFQTKYVRENFKDPYSYQFQNIVSKGVTRKEFIEEEITSLKSKNRFAQKKERKENETKIIEQSSILNTLPEDQKSEIVSYKINLDSYGANSYGNKVLGRYAFSISSDGSTIGRVYKYQ